MTFQRFYKLISETAHHHIQMSPNLSSEIQYQRDNYDIDENAGDAFSINETIKMMMQDMDEPDTVASSFKSELRMIGLKLGVYKPYTKEQLKNIYMTSGKKYEFKKGDIYYVFDTWTPLEQFNFND